MEGDLATRLARGDSQAFAELYDSCCARLYRFLLLQSLTPDEAQDTIQEVFLRLARHRQRLASVENLVAFTFQVARNELARFARRSQREIEKRQSYANEVRLDDVVGDSPLRLAERADDYQAMAELLNRLPDEQREMIVLKVFNEFSFREISEITGVAMGTVCTRYRRGIERLREWVGYSHEPK